MGFIGKVVAAVAAVGLAGAVSCARPSRAPLSPAPAPGAERTAAAAAASAPQPQATAPARAPSTTEHAAGVAAHPAARVDSTRGPVPLPPAIRPGTDSSSDDEFLDSLRTLTADSVARHAGSVTPEAVQRQATSLFGAAPALVSAATTWDIDVATYESNERVQAYIEFFTGRARGHFELYLARLARYESMIRTRLRAGGLPQDLVYLALIESGMNPNAVSRARAVGMWQFIKGTGSRYGLSISPWVDERRDPFLSTDAAVRLLRELNDRFGSLYLAAAAYNSGPGKVSRGLSRYDFGALSGNDVFFALAEEPFLRRETKDYVPKLIAAAIIAKQPARYGFTGIEPLPPFVYDSVQVGDAVGLDVLARLADTTQAALEDLNPQLVRRMTPPDRTVWVRIPVGKASTVATRLSVLPPRERITHVEHVIRRGETLKSIARLYHVSVDDIVSGNGGLAARNLRVGREITIPTGGVPSATRSAWRAEERTTSSRSKRTARRAGAAPAVSAGHRPPAPKAGRAVLLATAAPAGARRTVHIVTSGETLSHIAGQFHVPLASLLTANGLTARSRIKPGQAIRIPN